MIVRAARCREDLERVWRLTHDAFVSEGYAAPQPEGLLRHYPHLDEIEETTVFLAEQGTRLLGSISLTSDGPAGLHVDEDFPVEVDDARQRCRERGLRLGACWRAVTEPDQRNTSTAVLALIDACVREIKHRMLDITLYSFNPKHARVYQRLLDFQTIAGPRAGQAVAGAPAVLMRGSLWGITAAWRRRRLPTPGAAAQPVLGEDWMGRAGGP